VLPAANHRAGNGRLELPLELMDGRLGLNVVGHALTLACATFIIARAPREVNVSEPLYYWEGKNLLLDTVVHRKRYVLAPGRDLCYCPFDVRRWVMPPEDELLGLVWQQLARGYSRHLAVSSTPELEDAKAMVVWHFVVEHIRYTRENHSHDFWQFPPETLQLKTGDCEDKSFLCASLLLAAGIPADRVRVAIGVLARPGARPGSPSEAHCVEARLGHYSGEGHAWAMYQASSGVWCILEPNYRHLPTARAPGAAEWFVSERSIDISQAVMLPADLLAADGAAEQYVPLVCFNHRAVWSVEERFPGALRGAAGFVPDWRLNPTFDQILQSPQRPPIVAGEAMACLDEAMIGPSDG
jgi:hypothetical protein